MSRNQPPATFVDERPQPARVEAERSILGAILLDPSLLSPIAGIVQAEDFFRPEHGALFRLLLTMQAGGFAIDLVSVADKAFGSFERYGGPAYLAELPEHGIANQNALRYAEIVADAAQRRTFYKAAIELQNAALEQEASVDELQAAYLAIGAQLQAGRRRQWTEPLDVLYQALVERQAEEEDQAVPPPLSFGFPELDLLVDGGAQEGDLVVIGAPTGMGKSALATRFATLWAGLGRPVLYWSLEMPRRYQMTARALASASGQSVHEVRRGKGADLERWAESHRSLLLCDRPRATLDQVSAEARRIWSGGGLAALVVDHVGLMNHERGRYESKSDAIGRTANGLKQLALELKIAIVLVCQFNRAIDHRDAPKDEGPRWYDKVPLPQLSDLRDCGEIEQAADLVLFPMQAARYGLTGFLEQYGAIVVGKARNGPMGTIIPCRWDGPSTSYRPMGDG